MKLPKRYEGVKYDDAPKEIRAAFEKIKQSRRGMYIHGEVGTGKTHIAFALAAEAAKKGWPATFYNTTELLREIRMDFDRDAYSKKRIEDYLLSFEGLLFLDDIGSEKMTDWVGETFYLIVNRRYNAMLPTIFTSNFGVSDIAERIGDRTASRIVEMCDVFELVGSDRRVMDQKKTKINLQ